MNMLVRSTLREIRTSIARYLAIFAITALGVGFFSGLRICRADMTETADRYLKEHGMYDYMLVSSLGADDESVEIAEAEDGVTGAEGSVQIDVMSAVDNGSGDSSEQALRAISMPEKINTLNLVSGRMPEGIDECVADDYSMENEGLQIGDKIIITDNNDESRLVSFRSREFTVVGTVNSPVFLDYQRGSTDIGNGSLSSFFYISRDAFDTDYYTRLYLTLDGDEVFFTDEKTDQIDSAKDKMDDLAERITDARRDAVTDRARDEMSNPAGMFLGMLLLPAYETEKDDAAGRLAEIEKELESAAGEDREDLIKEKEALISVLRKTEKKIADADRMLDYAQRGMGDDGDADSYAVSVCEDPGYSSFESNVDIVSNVSRVFPVFFFLIAALVCMTTMTRMIDEQRSQIGVLKALGYSDKSITAKYMFYSGSAALLGSITGFFTGCRIFPFVIWKAYGIMYDFSSELDYVYDIRLGLLSLICALICTAGATWASLSHDFKVSPSELIRPKSPPAGKRILLERIKPLWDRVSFLYKVSFRNVFRDKKRFLMMVAGISGCTALLIAGMGIGTTVADIADHQFDEIMLYDYRVIFRNDMSESMQKDFIDEMERNDAGREDIKFVHQDEVKLIRSGKESDVTCIAADEDRFGDFIDLHQAAEPIAFPGRGEAVIVRNISRDHDISAGDSITIRAGGKEGELTVSGICDNFMYDTVYISSDTYETVFGENPEIKSALVSLGDADEAEIRESATAAANYEDTTAVSVNLDVRSSISKMMQSLDLVTYVIILSAALLAFVVIYNLTNINITERTREIATIKVLGFYQLEVAQYVFRENLFMTAIAALAGVPLGSSLLSYVFSTISMKMLYFESKLTFSDILMAVAMTFVFSVMVNLFMLRRLRNVSMTESLKSIE